MDAAYGIKGFITAVGLLDKSHTLLARLSPAEGMYILNMPASYHVVFWADQYGTNQRVARGQQNGQRWGMTRMYRGYRCSEARFRPIPYLQAAAKKPAMVAPPSTAACGPAPASTSISLAWSVAAQTREQPRAHNSARRAHAVGV